MSEHAPTIDESGAPAKDAVPAAAFGISAARRSQFGDIRRRFFRNKLAVLGLAMVGIVFAVAAFAPLLAPFDPRVQNLQNTTAKPSGAHWLGTDELGRDQLSRIIFGSRIAIVVGLASILLALLLGVILGSIAGYRGGKADSIVMRIADAFFAFPLLIGAILIILVTGRGVLPVILAIGIFTWAVPARLLRSSILSVREAGVRRSRPVPRRVELADRDPPRAAQQPGARPRLRDGVGRHGHRGRDGAVVPRRRRHSPTCPTGAT